MEPINADYIIVGAGSAGCVLANRLSADPQCRVVLIEAGGKGDDFMVRMPIGYGKTTGEFGHSWHYHSAPEPMIHNRRMLLPRGRGLGGSSNINGMLYVRGQQADFDQWSQLGAQGWGWSDVAPYFQSMERYAGGADDLRGGDGPLAVEEVAHRDPTNDAILRGFQELGVPMAADYNGADQCGAFYYQTTITNGRRWSSADAYLRPVQGRPNLRILTNATCERILFNGTRATGVEIDVGSKRQTLTAAREIILSAGAYHSPKLLMLSGIGPADHLNAMGIAVRHHSAEVGRNLQDHYIVTMSWRLKPDVFSYNRELGGPRLVWNVLKYVATRRGPMTIPVAQTGAFIKSNPALDWPDIQFHCLPVSGDLDEAIGNTDAKPSLSRHPGLTFGPNVLRPQSRGRVQLAAPDPDAVPDIVHNYLQAEEDQRLSLYAMRFARDLVAAPSLRPLVEAATWPNDALQSDDDLLDYARRYGNTGYHPVGTCRMGSDEAAVLDPHLRVRGVSGLRVVDASVMPTLVSGNTNAASIMIGAKGADLILQDA